MGLKTKNLTIKETGIELTEAYAIVDEIYLKRGKGYAVFNIQKDRESALKLDPLKQVKVQIEDIDRDKEILPQIYVKAKEEVTNKIHPQSKYPKYFTNWEDDK